MVMMSNLERQGCGLCDCVFVRTLALLRLEAGGVPPGQIAAILSQMSRPVLVQQGLFDTPPIASRLFGTPLPAVTPSPVLMPVKQETPSSLSVNAVLANLASLKPNQPTMVPMPPPLPQNKRPHFSRDQSPEPYANKRQLMGQDFPTCSVATAALEALQKQAAKERNATCAYVPFRSNSHVNLIALHVNSRLVYLFFSGCKG
jgi:hypothetical protein